MVLASPFERIHQLIGLIELEPTTKQVVRFLSQHVCPEGEISGISWMFLKEDGYFEYQNVSGLTKHLDPNIKVSVVDENVVSLALRTGKTQFFDITEMFKGFKGATHKKELSVYSSGLTMPIGDRQVLGVVFTSPPQILEKYLDYFECIRLILSLWQTKLLFKSKEIANEHKSQNPSLTDRQKNIVEMIIEGRTNASIASILGYSESLIRQETIIIYRKLGVKGRNELKNGVHLERVFPTHQAH